MEGQEAEFKRRLIKLLTEKPAYRDQWKRHAGRMITSAALNQRAVCEVIARQAWEEGEDTLASQIKDRLNRALGPRPRGVTGKFLELIIKGFSMAPEDAQYLYECSGGGGGVVLMGEKKFSVPPPRDYRTVLAQEVHRLGPDGLPFEHRTNLLLEATRALTFYPFITNIENVAIELVRGAHTIGKPYRASQTLTAVNLRFDEPVRPGETVALEYITRFLSRASPPPPELRRGVARIETLELCVSFHPSRIPSQVWWTEWDGESGPVLRKEDAPLRGNGEVSRVVRNVAASMVGFQWSFDHAQPA